MVWLIGHRHSESGGNSDAQTYRHRATSRLHRKQTCGSVIRRSHDVWLPKRLEVPCRRRPARCLSHLWQDWEMTKKSLRATLKDLNARRRLALFVGAGVSMGCGLPSWNELVRRVVESVWRHDQALAGELLAKPNGLAARYSKRQAGARFNSIVHDCLYRDDLDLSATVQAIAASGIDNICTFNFDDLLEEAFQIAGLEPDIATPNEAFTSRDHRTRIFHPHGFLSRFYEAGDIETANIVFSEDDYNALYSDPYSWANVSQLMLLSGFSVLFIGLSMQDPNLRRLIDVSRARGFNQQHFAVFRDPMRGADDVDRATKLRRLTELDLKSLGITPWFVDDHSTIAEILESISVASKDHNSPPHS